MHKVVLWSVKEHRPLRRVTGRLFHGNAMKTIAGVPNQEDGMSPLPQSLLPDRRAAASFNKTLERTGYDATG